MSERQGCSLRPLGCLAVLLLCGLCSTGTVLGIRNAATRGWIDAPELPDLPAWGEVRGTEDSFPAAGRTNGQATAPEGALNATSEATAPASTPLPTLLPPRAATDEELYIVSYIESYADAYRGRTGSAQIGRAQLFLDGEGGIRVELRPAGPRQPEEEWFYTGRTFWGRAKIKREVAMPNGENGGSQRWQWTGDGWKHVR